jgi:hypothetical protein
MIWNNKRVLKTQKAWQIPSWVKNQPKNVSLKEWKEQVKEWKLDKLIVLNKAPKAKPKTKNDKNEDDE